MRILEFEGDRRRLLPLLLLADEQEDMVGRYIDRGSLFVVEDGNDGESAGGVGHGVVGDVRAECIVTDEGNGILEIKNIAVDPSSQGKGYGRALVEYVASRFAGRFSVLQVGTGDSPLTVPFYEKCGFVRHHVIKDFFTDNYDHPIIEADVILKDMVVLQRRLRIDHMDIFELMEARHSVRNFTDRRLEKEAVEALNREIDACNAESGLNLQLVTDEPEAFNAGKPHYGSFSGCRNYLALVGPKDRDEAVGYYGERVVLKAQELGINSCWVALTYRKGKVSVRTEAGEKLHMVIALGYGANQGVAHRMKTMADVSDYREGDPHWYKNGLRAALLAPTAVNQQKYRFERRDDKVLAKPGLGFYTKVDLGIVKYHFELGSGRGKEVWV